MDVYKEAAYDAYNNGFREAEKIKQSIEDLYGEYNSKTVMRAIQQGVLDPFERQLLRLYYRD